MLQTAMLNDVVVAARQVLETQRRNLVSEADQVLRQSCNNDNVFRYSTCHCDDMKVYDALCESRANYTCVQRIDTDNRNASIASFAFTGRSRASISSETMTVHV